MVYFILLTLIEKKTKRNFILSKLYVIFKDIISRPLRISFSVDIQ